MFSSCELQKRRYSNGFTIQWHAFNKGVKEKPADFARPNGEIPERKGSNYNDLFADHMGNKLDLSKNEFNINRHEDYIESSSGLARPVLSAKGEFTHRPITEISESQISLPNLNESISEVFPSKKPKRKAFGIIIGSILTSILLFGAVLGKRRNIVTKMTRWAKRNQKKAIGVIAGAQVGVMAIGLQSGYSLNKLDIGMSDEMGIFLRVGLFLTLILAPFLPNKSQSLNPLKLKRNRFVYLLTGILGFLVIGGIGNKMESRFQDSIGHHALEQVDQQIFGVQDGIDIDSDDSTQEQRRKLFTAGAGLIGVLLILLAVILLCAGACSVGFGIWAFIEGGLVGEGVILLFLGWLLTYLGVLSIRAFKRKNNESINKSEMNNG